MGGAPDRQRSAIPPSPSLPHEGGDDRVRHSHHDIVATSFRGPALGLAVVPDALLLEGLGDFGGHVVLVVLGKHGVGNKSAGGIELALGHHALALAEEIGKDARVADGNGFGRVGDGERHGQSLAALQTALGDEAAETDALAGRDLLFHDILGRVKEDDGVAQRKQRGCRCRAFGLDRGLPFPLEDIPRAGAVLLAGSNPGETMPPLMQYFASQRANGGKLVVADPRPSTTAEWATIHLKLRPGSDAALANGLLHVCIRDGLIDERYIAARTEGFEDVRALMQAYDPARVAHLTGVAPDDLVAAAHILGEAPSTMILTGRGPEQQSRGVDNTLAFINLALALGQVGRAGGGYGCITGQGNGQGGREHGQKADQLPGYRRIDDPDARRHVAGVWGIPEEDLPGPGKSAYEMLSSMGTDGGVRALFVFGSNVAVSSPDAGRIQDRLQALDLLVVSDFFLSETAALADVVLPSAQWAEEDGTMTNLEGRVILRSRALPAPGDVRTDLEAIVAIADALGHGALFPSSRARDVFDELRRATAGGTADYHGITYERIRKEDGIFWPCPDATHPGTPRLFVEQFPTPSGRARFHAVDHHGPAEFPTGTSR